MKCKKALSLLLASVMMLGMVPASAVSGETVPAQDEPYVEAVGDETTAVPAPEVLPAADGLTGNRVDQLDSYSVYYEKTADPSTAQGGTYLLVDAAKEEAVLSAGTPSMKGVTIVDGRIDGEQTDAEWKITCSGGKLQAAIADGTKGLSIEQSGEIFFGYSYEVVQKAASGGKLPEFKMEQSGDTLTLSQSHKEGFRGKSATIYLMSYTDKSEMGITHEKSSATSFNLYEKKQVTASSQYVVNTEGLDGLLAQAAGKDPSRYEIPSWEALEQAVAAAQEAKGTLTQYGTPEEAETALAEIDRVHGELEAALAQLKELPAPEEITPEITWKRSEEIKHNNKGLGEVKAGVTFCETDRNGKTHMTWNWKDVVNLGTSISDPEKVWDFNTKNQYGDPNGVLAPVDGVIAATWNHRNKNGYCVDSDGGKASVRKFAGTFTWPQGYSTEDKAVITSVNDANYAPIYEYIEQRPELKARYQGDKVIPINDDMYVYVYREGDDPTKWSNEEAARHLVFWTGTTSQGDWSNAGGKTEGKGKLAEYHGSFGTPAYHGVWPNNGDTDARVRPTGIDGQVKLNHSDKWYTLVSTNALMSTLNDLYGSESLDGQTIHFDIYAMDYNTSGGMDKLEIRFEKAPATTAQVKVEYYLEGDLGDQYLGSTVMNGVPIGEEIILRDGTRENELDHYKGVAETESKKFVSKGEQQNVLTVQADSSKNIIRVLYTPEGAVAPTYYTYDFGLQNDFSYTVEGNRITAAHVEGLGESGSVRVEDGKAILSYTPADALGQTVAAVLSLDYGSSKGVEVPVRIVPASNVLYEDTFFQDEQADWIQSGTPADAVVNDNETTVYGYSSTYDGAALPNSTLRADVSAGKVTSNLVTTFYGTGFDLIGTSAPQTGTLFMTIQGVGVNEVVVVDTSHSEKTLRQVPLAHVMGLPEGSYTVKVFGAFRAAGTPAEGGPAVSTQDSTYVEVDGFRVYRSSDNTAYPAGERNAVYQNLLRDGIVDGTFTASVDGTGAPAYTAEDYESMGGPQNEIYLAKGQAVAFRVSDAAEVQMTVRAVDGTPTLDMGAGMSSRILSGTEMYRTIAPSAVQNGIVTIRNSGDGLLGLSNVKVKSASVNGAKLMAITEADRPAVLALLNETPIFVPVEFSTELQTVPGRRGRTNATLTVTASDDVDHLLVDGRRVNAVNGALVRLGLAEQYTFVVNKTFRRNAEPVFEVVAYNADGTASSAYVVEK